MAVHFLDSSAVVKYYVTEPGSTWIRQLIDGDELLFLAQITIPEVAAALGILERRKHISRRHRRGLWERFIRDCAKGKKLYCLGCKCGIRLASRLAS